MIRRPPAILVEDPPAEVVGGWFPDRGRVDLPLPSEPFDLGPRHVACPIRVDNGETARAALLAAMRNVALVIRLELPEAARAEFVDQLTRVADLPQQTSRGEVTDEQRELLRLLGLGMSVDEAGSVLGLSRRTAHRRLAAAREVLGVDTVMEAIVRVHHFTATRR